MKNFIWIFAKILHIYIFVAFAVERIYGIFEIARRNEHTKEIDRFYYNILSVAFAVICAFAEVLTLQNSGFRFAVA